MRRFMAKYIFVFELQTPSNSVVITMPFISSAAILVLMCFAQEILTQNSANSCSCTRKGQCPPDAISSVDAIQSGQEICSDEEDCCLPEKELAGNIGGGLDDAAAADDLEFDQTGGADNGEETSFADDPQSNTPNEMAEGWPSEEVQPPTDTTDQKPEVTDEQGTSPLDGVWSDFDTINEAENTLPVDNGAAESSSMFLCGARSVDNGQIVPKITTEGLDDSWTAQGDYPWTLLIQYLDRSPQSDDSTSAQVLCGASLLLSNIAITAAHCVDNKRAENLVVRAGEYELASDEETIPVQQRTVKQVIIHPKYDRRPIVYDVALLILSEPFENNDAVNTICLEEKGKTQRWSKCYATGWGESGQGMADDAIMKKAIMPLVSHDECEVKLRKSPLGRFFRLHSSFLCAGGDGVTDTCRGDGGGPFACQSAEPPYNFFLVGITSWGVGCAKKDTPGAYTNVSAVSDWIYSTILGPGVEKPESDWSYRVKS